MRIRFFITISAVLFIVSVSVLVIHADFLRREKLNSIDQQIRQTAFTLVNSPLSDLSRIDFRKADSIISEELGESRLGKFFVLRNSKGEIIYQSASINALPVKDIPEDQQWMTLTAQDSQVRVLNLKLPSVPDRTLQVGLIYNNDWLNPNYVTQKSLIFIISVLLIGLFASYILTSFLLRPIEALSRFISKGIEKLQSQEGLESIPTNLSADFIDRASYVKNDEFGRLIKELNTMIEKMNKFYKTSRLWAYQMAHELKTPLSIIRLDVEKLQKKLPHPDPQIESIEYELQASSHVIHSFLSWAELENSQKNKHLFAQKLSQIVKGHAKRLDPGEKRIEILLENECTVVCNPAHLDQLVVNLLGNALQYSENKVLVQIQAEKDDVGMLRIQDTGPGIPQETLDRMGEPFNKGSEKRGTGLGLAWVHSICNLYEWELVVTSAADKGTEVLVRFRQEN